MASGPAISIRIASKRFGQSTVFSEFRLDVAAGSVVALVGPSGVGKSTLLRMVAGIDRGFEGTISIDDTPAFAAPATGFLFQDARLLPWLSALDNICAVAPFTRVERAQTLLDRVGLHGVERAYPHQLSGGMQRRVAIARALAVNPKMLLLDEPFVSLDMHLAEDLRRVVHDVIRAEGTTVMIVSHVQDDIRELADRVVTIDRRPAVIISDGWPDRRA